MRFVEAQRSAARDLGLWWDGSANRFRGITGGVSQSTTITPTIDPNTKNDFGLPELVSPGVLSASALMTGFPSTSVPFGTFVAHVLSKGFSADAVVQALEKRGIARRLAEPNLVTLSGDTANFLAGGEFPFPVSAERDRITIEFKKFGVGLAFTPTVLASGQINLKIEPEVSDLDPNNTHPGGRYANTEPHRSPCPHHCRIARRAELRNRRPAADQPLEEHAGAAVDCASAGVRHAVSQRVIREEASRISSSSSPRGSFVRLFRARSSSRRTTRSVASNDRDFFLRGQLEIPKHFDAP